MRLMVKPPRPGQPRQTTEVAWHDAVQGRAMQQDGRPDDRGEHLLAEALDGLEPGWRVVKGCSLPAVRPGLASVVVPYVLVHRDLGVVVLELDPAGTDDAVERLRMLLLTGSGGTLDAEGVPVLHLRVPRDRTDRLSLALSHALQARRARGAASDGAWVSPVLATLRGSTLRGTAPAAPQPSVASATSPAMGGRIWVAAVLCIGGGLALGQLFASLAAQHPVGAAHGDAGQTAPRAPVAAAGPAQPAPVLPGHVAEAPPLASSIALLSAPGRAELRLALEPAPVVLPLLQPGTGRWELAAETARETAEDAARAEAAAAADPVTGKPAAAEEVGATAAFVPAADPAFTPPGTAEAGSADAQAGDLLPDLAAIRLIQERGDPSPSLPHAMAEAEPAGPAEAVTPQPAEPVGHTATATWFSAGALPEPDPVATAPTWPLPEAVPSAVFVPSAEAAPSAEAVPIAPAAEVAPAADPPAPLPDRELAASGDAPDPAEVVQTPAPLVPPTASDEPERPPEQLAETEDAPATAAAAAPGPGDAPSAADNPGSAAAEPEPDTSQAASATQEPAAATDAGAAMPPDAPAPAEEAPASASTPVADQDPPQAAAAATGAPDDEAMPAEGRDPPPAVALDAVAQDRGDEPSPGAAAPAPTQSPAPGEAPPALVAQPPAAPPAAAPPAAEERGPAPTAAANEPSRPPREEAGLAGNGPPRVAAPAAAMSPALVTALIRRGDAMLALGDVSAARLLYERAAAGGSGAAALAAGRTYDPRILEGMGARGLRPDPATAARWYERAIALGEAEAEPLLRAVLAGRGN